MLQRIGKCQKCELHRNQSPLLDKVTCADIMFVGLSAKFVQSENEVPLDRNTKSGDIIAQLEKIAEDYGYTVYRTNLVKCVPLDANGKIRYPNTTEMATCLDNFFLEYEYIQSKIVVLLGGQVQKAFENYFNRKFEKSTNCKFVFQKVDKYVFVLGYHPSYILRNKSKMNLYLDNFESMLREYKGE